MTVLTKYNTECNNTIQQRQEGKDVLSWIEKFCIHLLKEKDQLRLFFKGDEHVLVFRVTDELESQNLISGYYCYFKTNNGHTRFCVNKSVDLLTPKMRELFGLNGANWESEATQKWWDQVFLNGDVAYVDEDTLKRKEVKVSGQLDTNMHVFINSIQNEFDEVVKLMNDPNKPPKLDLSKISKVLVVGEYASALPLKYALKELFKSEVLPITEPIYNYTWQNSANFFYAPGTLLRKELNTSSKMTISDVIKLDQSDIVFTVPMKEDNGKCCLPSTALFNGCDLKWNELMKGDVQYDYRTENLLFKRVHLSMIADGFQTLYVKSGSDVVAYSVYEKGKYNIKVFPSNISEEQKSAKNKTEQGQKDDEGGIDLQVKDKNEEIIIDDSVFDASKEGDSNDVREINAISKDQKKSTLIDFEEKADKIVFRIHQGVKRTAKGLESIARGFLLKKYFEEIPKNASDSEKEVFWKKKYEGCLSLGWQKIMLSNWKKYGQIEYGNFYSFLRAYQYKGLPGYIKVPKFSIIDSSVAALKDIRNLNAHANNEKILAIGYTKILFSFEHMTRIAEQLKDKELLEILEKYKSEIEKEWDGEFTNYLNSKSQSS